MGNIAETIVPIAALGILGVAGYFALKDLLGGAAGAGAATAQALQNTWQDITQERGGLLTPAFAIDAWLRSLMQSESFPVTGFTMPIVPPTPAGNLPTNWTWQGPCDVSIGLPAGMTFGEFCNISPGSPMCAPGYNWGC